jgi:hypothetical protein
MQDQNNNESEIRIFSSFEEAAEYEATFNASLTGVQHLQNVTAFLMERYKEELSRPNKNELYFDLNDKEK